MSQSSFNPSDEIKNCFVSLCIDAVSYFGIPTDGVTDATSKIQNAFDYASQNKTALLFRNGTYLIKNNIIFKSDVTVIGGNDTIFLFASDYTPTGSSEFAIYNDGWWITTDILNIRIENIRFAFENGSVARKCLAFFGVSHCRLKNLCFDCSNTNNSIGYVPIDIYGACRDFIIEDCKFICTNGHSSGGTWVRNFSTTVKTEDIKFLNCNFYNKKGDDVIAVWGKYGVVENIIIDKCNFYNIQDTTNNCAHLITLGNGSAGTINVRMTNCNIYCDYVKGTVIKCTDGTIDDITIDNCSFYLNNQLDSSMSIFYAGVLGDLTLNHCNIYTDATFTKSIGYNTVLNNCNIESNNSNKNALFQYSDVINCRISAIYLKLFSNCSIVKNNTVNVVTSTVNSIYQILNSKITYYEFIDNTILFDTSGFSTTLDIVLVSAIPAGSKVICCSNKVGIGRFRTSVVDDSFLFFTANNIGLSGLAVGEHMISNNNFSAGTLVV